jgi:hypothetical protein
MDPHLAGDDNKLIIKAFYDYTMAKKMRCQQKNWRTTAPAAATAVLALSRR